MTTVNLSAQDRRETGALAAELAATPPGLIDDPHWVAEARRMSCVFRCGCGRPPASIATTPAGTAFSSCATCRWTKRSCA
ncbi:hypothetical protein [Streptomyces sp. 11-1-2]|uniref:hypothetical protein n=1 Tax=unclassified Streptomyces TaxID=2593676 RepID=UPI001F08F789|nr:hypothetical protein [Streptomyces sp. 11-1-2]